MFSASMALLPMLRAGWIKETPAPKRDYVVVYRQPPFVQSVITRLRIVSSDAKVDASYAELVGASTTHPDHCLCDACVTLENMDERLAKSDAHAAMIQAVVKYQETQK